MENSRALVPQGGQIVINLPTDKTPKGWMNLGQKMVRISDIIAVYKPCLIRTDNLIAIKIDTTANSFALEYPFITKDYAMSINLDDLTSYKEAVAVFEHLKGSLEDFIES